MTGGRHAEAALFPGALAPFRGGLTWDDDRFDCSATLDQMALRVQLTRFQRSVDGAWQPACSFWAQLYFNSLLIPATCLLGSEAEAARLVADITTRFCPSSGRPLGSTLCEGRVASRPSTAPMADVLDAHVDRLIADLGALSRLSRPMLRESATRSVAWTIDQIAAADPAAAQRAKASLAARPACCFRPSERDRSTRARRTCCLRDRLSTVGSCGAICPRVARDGRSCCVGSRKIDARDDAQPPFSPLASR